MPFISLLKESFATAPIQNREAIVEKLATANTEDGNYYQGLVILQKIYDQVMKHPEPSKTREATSAERELSNKMQEQLNKFSYQNERFTELNTRYHLLIYPFDTIKSLEFIKSGLYLDLVTQKQDQQNLDEVEHSGVATLPSALDENLIDGFSVLKKSFDEYHLNGSLDVDVLAYPSLKSEILEKNLLSEDEEVAVLKLIFMHPTERVFGNNILDRLAKLWKLQSSEDSKVNTETWRLEDLPFYNFTLLQMDQLIQKIPDIALLHENFVRAYIEKLIPAQYFSRHNNGESITFWYDDENVLQGYLNDLEKFASKLPAIYYKVKAAIKFYQLRIDIVKQNFDQQKLVEFLASSSGTVSTPSITSSKITNLFSFNNSNVTNTPQEVSYSNATVDIPLLGSCDILEQDKLIVVQEYLTGLVSQGNLNINIESLGAYMNYHQVLKPLYAKIMLTVSSAPQQTWSTVLGSYEFEKLVSESSVSFTPATLNTLVKRKPTDSIKLSVRTKNIQRLSVRVFQIDMENYCRLHIDSDNQTIADKNKKIDLDGLCPTWEKDIDFSSYPSICVKTNDFIFGNEGFAPEIFSGRGLWVIEFVGGQNQCRAIVQKGYLRHVIQESIGGHVVRILDEECKPLEDAKVWAGNQYHLPDDSKNILIPYLPFDAQSKMSKMLLISNVEGFSETASYYRLSENYKLEADFFVNPEMVSFNKKVTVVVTPRLSMNGTPVSLSLLEKASLGVQCTNADNVTNSTICQSISKSLDVIHFVFMVPERLSKLEFNLQGKIRTLNDTLESTNVTHTINYPSTSDHSGTAATVQLRRDIDGNHFVHAFGKNGEPKKDHELSFKLKHGYLSYRSIEVSLRTNSEGYVQLGNLDNIQWVELSDSNGLYKQWLVNAPKQSLLPPAVCISTNTPFKIIRPILPISDSLFSLYKIGIREMLVENVSNYIKLVDNHIVVSGLPQGEYMLYIASVSQGTKQIKCTVIENYAQLETTESNNRGLWSDWIIGNNTFAKQNGIVSSRPLDITDIDVSEDNVSIKLQNWSSKSYIIATTSTFSPASNEHFRILLDNRSLTRPFAYDLKSESTKSFFLDDKTLGEEYQYVLNRARAEKWVGSNLTKPSLLMYPKKNADTTSDERHLEIESIKKKSSNTLFGSSGYGGGFGSRDAVTCSLMLPQGSYSESGLAFLDHQCPVLIIPVMENGIININRQLLGTGGTYLQVIAISGEQAVSRNTVLSGASPVFKLNDLRQNSSANKAIIRSKIIKNILPNENLEINTNEYETIDSFEKLFDITKIISTSADLLTENFEFLKKWPTMKDEKKLETHEKNVCHELNLWLKKKDPQFFEQFVRPALESKIQKSFMDLYLIDGDLSEFSDSIYKYNQLNTAEKALLATTRPKGFLETVLRSFKDALDDKKVDSRSDAIFDSILAGSALSIEEESDSDEGYALLSSAENYSYSMNAEEPAAYSACSAPGVPERGMMLRSMKRSAPMPSAPPPPPPAQDDGPVKDNSEDLLEVANELRKKAKQLQKKATYEFVKPTTEWVEMGHFNEHDTLPVKKFWVDYLEHHLNDNKEQSSFLSSNFIYSLDNLTEISYVLSLTDLPFASESKLSVETTLAELEGEDSKSVKLNISSSSGHPLMVFYRTLTESTAPFSASNDKNANNLMLGQEFFLYDENTPIDSDECIKVNPLNGQLESNVLYGSHIIISNASGKPLTCQVTVQVPTGSIPCQNTSYCKTKTISIEAYSTWHEVTGSFYFPTVGVYFAVPVTVSSLSGDKLLGKIESVELQVIDKSGTCDVEEESASQTLSLSSWPTLANSGSNTSVLAFLEGYKKLDRLDLNKIEWRMKDKQFARQAFDILSTQRHFFDKELWKYGVYHQFEDIISDLLQFTKSDLLANTGQVFDSPLVRKRRRDDAELFDYYPLLNARAHPLKPAGHEILNAQFYKQYDEYLDYLSLMTREPSSTDLVVLGLYLVLQDRIGDAQAVFSRIESSEIKSTDCQVQLDYLEAYLKTRIPVTSHSEQQSQDLKSVKEIVSKYIDFGVLRWRKMFTNLYDFICEIEQGENTALSKDSDSLKIRSEPILEFDIQDQELVIQYASVKAIDVKFYEINIEVMFSSNPFMNNRATSLLNKENFTWIKPSHVLRVDLPEKQTVSADVDDFEMIGVGQDNSVQTMNVPFIGGNKNMFIELSSVGTPNTIRRRQAYFSHSLHTHIAESFGIIRILSKKTKRPLAGTYVKVYAKMKDDSKPQFWKDGYTGLNGVFDYIGVNEGNALTGGDQGDIKTIMNEKIHKLSILIIDTEEGAVVREAYPPSTE